MDNAKVAERLALRFARRAVHGGRQHLDSRGPGTEIVGRDTGDGNGRAFATRHVIVNPENRQFIGHLYADPRCGGDHRAGDFVVRGKHGARLGQFAESIAKCGFVRRRIIRFARRERNAVLADNPSSRLFRSAPIDIKYDSVWQVSNPCHRPRVSYHR